jgi:hypothetical protein
MLGVHSFALPELRSGYPVGVPSRALDRAAGAAAALRSRAGFATQSFSLGSEAAKLLRCLRP